MVPARLYTHRFASVIFLSLILVVAALFPSVAKAADSCTASASPSSVQTSTTTIFNFSVTNTGEAAINYIGVQPPSSNFTLYNYGATGWDVATNNFLLELTGGSIAAGATFDFSVRVATGSNEASSANWQISTNTGGGEVNCTGSLGIAISGVRDATAPIMGETITISDVGSTSVKINWTTNENSNSVVNYGTTADYGSTATDASMTTSHSLTLSSLTANTTYYFYVSNTDGSGNTVSSVEETFVTAAAGTSTTTSTTTTTTTTVAATATPTPKPLKDTVAPSVSINTNFDKPFTEAPTITGRASDTGAINVGVASVEYSIDDGRNWLPVDSFEFRNSNFEFVPVIFEDGNYKIKARAIDKSGNIGSSKTYTLIIDRLPPQVGGVLFSLGPQVLIPTKTGAIFTLQGVSTKITLSAVGGPLSIDLISGTQTFSLVKNNDNGLWSGVLNFAQAGVYELTAKSVDGAENETERKLNTIIVLAGGKILNGTSAVTSGNVTLWYFDNQTQRFVIWDGKPYGQSNPQKITKSGEYGFFAPAGKYYLEAKSYGFKTLRTKIFTLDTGTPITTSLKMVEGFRLRFGSFVLALPDFSVTTQTIVINSPALPAGTEIANNLVGREFPNVDLFSDARKISTISLRGKPAVFTFLSTWSPYTPQQLSQMGGLSGNSSVNILPVVSQETASSVSIFRKRGGYSFAILADPDGLLVKPLSLSFLPTHVFVDRKGTIKAVKVGVLTAEEMMEGLVN